MMAILSMELWPTDSMHVSCVWIQYISLPNLEILPWSYEIPSKSKFLLQIFFGTSFEFLGYICHTYVEEPNERQASR